MPKGEFIPYRYHVDTERTVLASFADVGLDPNTPPEKRGWVLSLLHRALEDPTISQSWKTQPHTVAALCIAIEEMGYDVHELNNPLSVHLPDF